MCLSSWVQILFPLGRLSVMIYGCLASIIFCGYIIYDTDNLIKRYSYDEYIWAAVSLYLDIINLFLALLTVFRAADSWWRSQCLYEILIDQQACCYLLLSFFFPFLVNVNDVKNATICVTQESSKADWMEDFVFIAYISLCTLSPFIGGTSKHLDLTLMLS